MEIVDEDFINLINNFSQSQNSKIKQYLNGLPELMALVDVVGNIFYVKQQKFNRPLKILEDLVLLEFKGSINKIEVIPTDFNKLKKGNFNKISDNTDIGTTRTKTESTNGLVVNRIFEQAVEAKASDIYVEIRKKSCDIYFKAFKFKHHFESYSKEEGLSIARGIYQRAVTQFDPSEPCDCSFEFESQNKKIYCVRANSIKTTVGNTVCCRVRDPSEVVEISDLGYAPSQIDHLKSLHRSPGGMLLITGETNSGKSTTVASLMNLIPKHKTMIEIADPVEVEFDTCSHIEIDNYHADAEAIFAKILSSTVRQNPDILVLGEIRDKKTVDAAMNMAIAGKRVLSTLHTSSCVGAFPRLKVLGVDEHLLSLKDFIAGIVNQNLVPVICPNCCLPQCKDPQEQIRFENYFGQSSLRFINTEGCSHCRGGISGQTLVAEVYPLFLDDGDVYNIITKREFYRLPKYMKEKFNVLSKMEHAASKVKQGILDPEITESIIGLFI